MNPREKYGDEIDLARFLKKQYLREANTRIHTDAFKVQFNELTTVFEISLFQIQGTNAKEKQHLAEISRCQPIAYCSFSEVEIRDIDVVSHELVYDDTPPHHVNLTFKANSKLDILKMANRLTQIANSNNSLTLLQV